MAISYQGSIDKYLLAELPNTDHGRALFDYLKKEKDELEKKSRESSINNENFQKDIRFVLGKIDFIEKLLTLPEKMKKLIEQEEKNVNKI